MYKMIYTMYIDIAASSNFCVLCFVFPLVVLRGVLLLDLFYPVPLWRIKLVHKRGLRSPAMVYQMYRPIHQAPVYQLTFDQAIPVNVKLRSTVLFKILAKEMFTIAEITSKILSRSSTVIGFDR